MALLVRGLAVAVAALATATALGGCASSISFDECTTDIDCVRKQGDGGMLYCTSDHLCIGQLPSERICNESFTSFSDTIKAGDAPLVVASMVDRNDALDKETEKAIKLAVDEINMRQAGASQPIIELRLCDTGFSVEQTLRVTQIAVEKYKARALVGPTSSGLVLSINQYIVDHDVLVVSPSATSSDVSSLADGDRVWRTAPSDALQAKLLVAEVKKDTPAPTKVSTLYVDTVYGKGLSDAFVVEYDTPTPGLFNGVTIKYTNALDQPAAVNMLVSAGAPSHALLVADEDVGGLMQRIMQQAGLDATHFFMTDTAKVDTLFGTTAKPTDKTLLDRVRGTAPALPTSNAYTAFRNAYMARFQTDPSTTSFTATGYDAVYLVAVAAGATTGHLPGGKELAMGLRKLADKTGTVRVLGKDYLPALQDIGAGPVRLEGASGPLFFDKNGDPTNGSFEFWGVDTTTTPYKFKTLPP